MEPTTTADCEQFSVIKMATPIPDCAIYVQGNDQSEILRINHDGSIVWKGREVETDEEFRAAMMDMANALRGATRA